MADTKSYRCTEYKTNSGTKYYFLQEVDEHNFPVKDKWIRHSLEGKHFNLDQGAYISEESYWAIGRKYLKILKGMDIPAASDIPVAFAIPVASAIVDAKREDYNGIGGVIIFSNVIDEKKQRYSLIHSTIVHERRNLEQDEIKKVLETEESLKTNLDDILNPANPPSSVIGLLPDDSAEDKRYKI